MIKYTLCEFKLSINDNQTTVTNIPMNKSTACTPYNKLQEKKKKDGYTFPAFLKLRGRTIN